jgi:hypothetical protein
MITWLRGFGGRTRWWQKQVVDQKQSPHIGQEVKKKKEKKEKEPGILAAHSNANVE